MFLLKKDAPKVPLNFALEEFVRRIEGATGRMPHLLDVSFKKVKVRTHLFFEPSVAALIVCPNVLVPRSTSSWTTRPIATLQHLRKSWQACRRS